MKTTDLFKFNRSADRLNESMEKMFGTKLNLASFNLPKLEDARNKLRTQLHDARSQSGFNENIENEAVTQAQWMLDAINSEIAERQEFIADPHQATAEYTTTEGAMDELHADLNDKFNELAPGIEKHKDKEGADRLYNELAAIAKEHGAGSEFRSMLNAARNSAHMDYDTNPGGFENWFWYLPLGDESEESQDDEGGETDDGYALASAGFGSDEDYESIEQESAPPTAKGERMVKHIKKGYADDGKLTDKEKSIAYATAWKQHNKKNESVNTGDNMTRLNEGEVQQASAIVTAKTMVDRVSRWIEELSGMENDTLLQLGDSIRDEMSAEQAKTFISACAPAIQAALENLKTTRETLSTGVRMLTGEEQGAEMLGSEPGAEGGDEMGAAEPDMMNDGGDELGDLTGGAEDDFGAADPAAGGLGDAGREQRESIDRSNSLLRVLAG